MDYLKKTSKAKLIVMLLSMLLPIIVIIVMAVGKFKISEGSIFAIWEPLPYIICALLEGYIGYKNYRYIKILRDDDYADYVLIKKNDERNKMINLKTNALVHKIFIYVLGIALIFSAFVNKEYFYMCAILFGSFVIIHVAVAFYYHKKY